MKLKINSKKYGVFFTLIDEEDYEKIKEYTLNINKKDNAFYVSLVKGKTIRLAIHRFLMNPPKHLQVDHKNRNPLDNRKENLRVSTQKQNSYNKFDYKKSSSGFKGVYWVKDKRLWCSRITVDGKVVMGGYFRCKIDAAHKYNELAKEYFGEFAYLNAFTKEDLKNRMNDPVFTKDKNRALSGYKGVFKMPSLTMGDRYVAHIRYSGKKIHIGCYSSANEAAIAYNQKAIELFGEKAYLNPTE